MFSSPSPSRKPPPAQREQRTTGPWRMRELDSPCLYHPVFRCHRRYLMLVGLPNPQQTKSPLEYSNSPSLTARFF